VSAAQGSLPAKQARLARVTLNLERAFDYQFVRGAIDEVALSSAIDDVLDAMPEAARPRVQVHIEAVLRAGERLVSETTPAERAQATASPALESLDKTQQAQIKAWGWPGAAGWSGGLGAFGFPLMYRWGAGYR
jgi:hypothetical protein